MRKWTVEGTDNAGESRRISVDAQDEGDAQHKAYLRGVTATAVYIFNPTADPLTDLAAAQPVVEARYAKPPKRMKHADDEIQGAAWRLRAADFVLSVMGGVYIAGGILIALIVLIQDRLPWWFALGYLVGFAAAGVLFLGAGAALRMLALIGISSATAAK